MYIVVTFYSQLLLVEENKVNLTNKRHECYSIVNLQPTKTYMFW